MTLKQSLAQSIRAKREASGLSQDKLASKAELSTRYYQSIESADKQPSIGTIFKLAVALECDYTELLKPVWKYWQKESEK